MKKTMGLIVMGALVLVLWLGAGELSDTWANVSPGGAGNYTWLDNVTTADATYSFIDVSGGTVITTYAAAASLNNIWNITLPFTITYYGTGYSSVNVAENGYLRFAAGNDYELNQTAVPSSVSPTGACVFVMHDDLGGQAGAWIRYQNFGTTPNQYTVIEWYAMYTVLRGVAYNTSFEAILYENGTIKCQYADTFLFNSGGCYPVDYYSTESATIGLENSNGTVGRQYLVNSNQNYDGRAILYGPAEKYLIITYSSQVQGGTPIKRGETVAMEKFTLSKEVGSMAWNTIKITKTGTAPDSAVEEARLYQDANANAQWDIGDTLVKTGTFTNGTVTLTLSNMTLDTTARTFFIVYKLSNLVPGGTTLGAKISSLNDLTGATDLFAKEGSF